MFAGGLTLQSRRRARLATATVASATPAVCHWREGLRLRGVLTRDQNDGTMLSSSALARATSASTEDWVSVKASRRSRAIADTRRNSSTWTGEALSKETRVADS